MPGCTTSAAPPLAAPATMRADWPAEATNVLMAGFGPMYVASIAPADSASIAAGPALNTCVESSVSPSASSMRPSSSPTSAGACVTFAK